MPRLAFGGVFSVLPAPFDSSGEFDPASLGARHRPNRSRRAALTEQKVAAIHRARAEGEAWQAVWARLPRSAD